MSIANNHPAEKLLATLQATHTITTLSIISSTKIRNKVETARAALNAHDASKPALVALTARATVVNKAISIVEILKRDLVESAEKGGKVPVLYQYTRLGSVQVALRKRGERSTVVEQDGGEGQDDGMCVDETVLIQGTHDAQQVSKSVQEQAKPPEDEEMTDETVIVQGTREPDIQNSKPEPAPLDLHLKDSGNDDAKEEDDDDFFETQLPKPSVRGRNQVETKTRSAPVVTIFLSRTSIPLLSDGLGEQRIMPG